MSLPADCQTAIDALPASLRARVQQQAEDFFARAADVQLPVALVQQLPSVWATSPFVAGLCLRYPYWLGEFSTDEGVGTPAPENYSKLAYEAVAQAEDIPSLKRVLREIRQQCMLRLAWRDLADLDDLDTTLNGLSAMADALVDAALNWLEIQQIERHGQPLDSKGQPIRLVVLGMGKLGGRELNFSSDIDLIFAYSEAGQTDGPKPLSHEQYFRALAQQLVQVLNERTEHGFVFRVDTRLRPFGDSGPLVMHFAAMEQYYQLHGREWERYAWIKARPIAGDLAEGARLMDHLRPFVYRRYLDYSVYDSLRDMKGMIERETIRKGMQANIKLGRGGIREIEFIAQVYQLIRGGQDRALQARGLRRVLSLLGHSDLLPDAAITELDSAYVFLRRLENRMQAYADHQTHDLPRDSLAREALALAMGFDAWETLEAETARVRESVYGHFRGVFGSTTGEAGEAGDGESERASIKALRVLWLGQSDASQAEVLLSELGYEDGEQSLKDLTALRESGRFRNLGETARRRINDCVPLLIQAAAQTASPSLVLRRMLKLLQALSGRTTYVALLVENPTAIPQLARLCAASTWIAEEMVQHPMLLDSLLDPRILYSPPRRPELQQDMADQIAQIAADDLESLMDHVRRYKQLAVLRVAAADVSNAVPLMVVSDHLTEIAEVVLEHALSVTESQLQQRHGLPVRADGTQAGFAVLAYGKFGGIELGYGSDLDLVFVHDGESTASTDGDRAVSHDVYFNRLGQRLIHFLSAFTPAGRVYEVDMRLRPNGESGLLVPNFDALASYQREHAWTWEHQALVRARPVAGSHELADRFNVLRQEILCRSRDAQQLRQAVIDMREKMRKSLEQREAGMLDLKQGSGGIADLEFVTQYFVLRSSQQYPELARYTDNIRILDALGECGLWSPEDVQAMSDAYRAMRKQIHLVALQASPALVPEAMFADEVGQVRDLWQRMMLSSDAP